MLLRKLGDLRFALQKRGRAHFAAAAKDDPFCGDKFAGYGGHRHGWLALFAFERVLQIGKDGNVAE